MTKLRQIVKDAFKCNELVYQFGIIDVEDTFLIDGTEEEVNEKYSDAYIIGEAENRLAICNANEDDPDYQRDARQLERFINKYSKAVAKPNKPEEGKQYLLIGGKDKPSIANGNTWAESEIGAK
tara:strand:+ start:6817 stop:7188 length:372 start_codon:yes stop_codon:yes gene_type:complete